jgi:ABC-type multidrug transport system ATPase subunit
MGYCPQHDAQWKNITVREHLECYAAIRGVPSSDINRYVNMNKAVYCYREIYYMRYENRRVTGLVTSYAETAF